MTQNRVRKIKNVDVRKFDVDRVINLTINLINALNEENNLLDKMNINKYSAIVNNKLKIIDELDIHQKIIEKKPELIKQADPNKIHELKNLKPALDHAKTVNKERLEMALYINKKVVDLVMRIVAEDIAKKSGYSSNGNYSVLKKMEEMIPSLTYNQEA